MQLNDKSVKELIGDYAVNPSQKLEQIFQVQIHDIVRQWPKRQYHCNEDICADFLVYILDHTSEILKSFPLGSPVTFLTWFNAVLYNKFNDFSKLGEIKEIPIRDCEIEDIAFIPIFGDSYDMKKVDDIIHQLTPLEEGLLTMYIAPYHVRAEHMEEIALYTGQDLQKIILIHQNILKYHVTIETQKQHISLKLKTLDHKIAHMENILKRLNVNDEKISILENKILRFKNKRYKNLRSLKGLYKNTSFFIAALFPQYDMGYRFMKKTTRKIKQLILVKENRE